jgi:hypothetical protein
VARFNSNRRWTFVLALGVSLLLSSFYLPRASASGDPGSGMITDPGEPPPGSSGSGDPDVPIGPSKTARSGRLSRGNTELGTRSAGDERFARGVSMWRLRVVLQGLRSFYFRF